MPIRSVISAFAVALFVLATTGLADETVDFNRDIRPILATHCFACHGPDEEARKADLRLDQLADAAVFEPGKPDESELIARIEHDDPEQVMPPPKNGKLNAEEKQKLRDWVAAGARYEIHWSFVPPRRSTAAKGSAAIDELIEKKLAQNDLAFAEPADRYQLIRRVSLDLTGLPPTLEMADAFANDADANAYEKVVDRLLESSAFGEHWARMWLDLARYADTKGYEKDLPRQIWRYRDWVIEAFNNDTPYDQFTREQLAGDLLSTPTSDQLLATAFHRNTMTNDEGGTDNEEFRVAAVKDRVDTTMQVWMGLTMGCAKCHSHKYDPISQHDYYQFYAFFNQTQDADRNDDFPTAPTPTAAQTKRLEALAQQIQRLEHAAGKPAGFDDAYAAWRNKLGEIWRPLSLAKFESKHDVSLEQTDDGLLIAQGKQPAKDTWRVTLSLPETGEVTSLRLDLLPKPKDAAGWPDRNVALREITASVVAENGEETAVKLINPRADFSQRGWEVAKAIDGNANVGWAISPQLGKPHAAVFDLAEPLRLARGMSLKLTLDQQYGESLLLTRFRVSASGLEPQMLTADLNVEASLENIFTTRVYEPTAKIHRQIAAVKKEHTELQAGISKTPVMQELSANKQRKTHIHVRGNFLEPGEEVTATVPLLFGELPPDSADNRLGVANWLMQAENPLTARVMANRIWARLFGVGIVETEEDFGVQGAPPSNQELLDMLAVEFRENGWSMKQLIRTIVLSRAYRQSSVVTERKLAIDPNNRLISRGPRFRLSAEVVRDQALAAASLLVEKIGGPSVMPPQPPNVWSSTYSALKWKNASGADRYRRGLYTYWKRTSPYPSMLAFDAGSGEVCLIRRVRTNTPLQALVTLNDTVFIEAAGALSQRMASEHSDLADQIEHGFRLVLVRPPSKAEVNRLTELYESLADEFTDETAAELVSAAGLKSGDAAMIAVANVLLNLDETLMKP